MSNIVQIDEYDLILSQTWQTGSTITHGISGHLFEIIDYYMILKNHFNVGIAFFESFLSWDKIEKSIRNKYEFTEEEILDIKSVMGFYEEPSLVRCKNILFVDGDIINLQHQTIIADNILCFACGDKSLQEHTKDNMWVIQDERVYPKCLNGINYKKKVLFDRIKRPEKSDDGFLLYLTTNCRFMAIEQLILMIAKYGKDKKYKIITNDTNYYDVFGKDNIKILEAPIENIYEQFDTYVYTPVERKMDCSPRMIAECKYLQKEVLYYKIDYLDEDRGLYWRKWDIENDFDSLFLRDGDEIIEIIQKIIDKH